MAVQSDDLTSASRMGIWHLDLPTGEILWNAAQYDLHSVNPAEITLSLENWAALLAPGDDKALVDHVNAAVDNHQPFSLVYTLRDPDAAATHLWTRGEVLPGKDGTPAALSGFTIDHGRMNYLDSEHLRQKVLIQSAADTIPGAMFEFRIGADGSESIEYMSPGALEIWGHPPEHFHSNPGAIWAGVSDADRREFLALRDEAGRALQPLVRDWQIRMEDGSEKWLRGKGSPRPGPDGSMLWSVFVFDITRQIEMEVHLGSSHKMLFTARKFDALARLSRGVAHDVNNLLAVLQGNLELVSDEVQPGSRDLIDDMLEACEQGKALTQQLLWFGRRAALSPRRLSLNEILGRTERLVRKTMPETVTIDTVQTAGVWAIEADPDFLERSVLNLVLNARDAMPDGGCLTIEVANVRISDEYVASRHEELPPGRYVMLAVSDDGSGMSGDVQDSAFEPFFTTRPAGKGTGMGLSVVHGFVRQSRGIVEIYSEPGIGTTVKLFFPAVGGATSQSGVARINSRGLQGDEHVLIVEDDTTVRSMLIRQLTQKGYRVTDADSGQAGLAIIEADPTVDLIVTDVVMPGTLQGPQLAREARKLRPDLPVVFLSGYPQEAAVTGDGVRSRDIQLMKPVAFADLARALRVALES